MFPTLLEIFHRILSMKVVAATNNPNKLSEFKMILGQEVEIQSLNDIGWEGDIPETGDTLVANALQKANTIFEFCKLPCISDDTGLEIEALEGRPGVFSARYAGADCSPKENMNKVLNELEGVVNRKATFRTIIAFLAEGVEEFFEGSIEGNITEKESGAKGFGYDPIFKPEGYKETFAEMPSETKNSISHRGRALRKLEAYFKEYHD